MIKKAYLVASGDLRLAANQNCWKAQSEMEAQIVDAFRWQGVSVERAHPYDPNKQHGFIDSQHYGMEVFHNIPANAPVIVAEAVWQYSHHVLAGLIAHQGPILTLANWSGTWPGLVGLLNLNASLTKAGVQYDSLWSDKFDDKFFTNGISSWIQGKKVRHDKSHLSRYVDTEIPTQAEKVGARFAKDFRARQAIMGVFDEGCMGMYNAIAPDELLNKLGIYKERLSQSSLYARMQTVPDHETLAAYNWLVGRGMKFNFGENESTDLTERQVLEQLAMYIAALRIADDFGCDTIGIQYQQGLKDLTVASDLAEALLNSVERPPVTHESTGKLLFDGDALPHFNEVDECAGIDALVTYLLWKQLGLPPENTLHDLRWGRQFSDGIMDEFVWVLEISGAVPPAHFEGGYRGATSERQPPMFFRLGGGTVKGVSKPGWVVWSRVFIEAGKLKYDTGILESVELPQEETEARWHETTSQWPVMHAVFQGISRDQMMARHKSNHIHVAYATDKKTAKKAMYTKAAAMHELGMEVTFCGDV
jgi:L-fucose isomerase-like protein